MHSHFWIENFIIVYTLNHLLPSSLYLSLKFYIFQESLNVPGFHDSQNPRTLSLWLRSKRFKEMTKKNHFNLPVRLRDWTNQKKEGFRKTGFQQRACYPSPCSFLSACSAALHWETKAKRSSVLPVNPPVLKEEGKQKDLQKQPWTAVRYCQSWVI